MSENSLEIARLLEEQLWCNFEDVDALCDPTRAAPISADAVGSAAAAAGPLDSEEYLRREVFPTLVPALHELLKRSQHFMDTHDTESQLSSVKNGSKSGNRDTQDDWGVCHVAGMDTYGPTGSTHMVSWLADYLLRNNMQNNDLLAAHPFNKFKHGAFDVNVNITYFNHSAAEKNEMGRDMLIFKFESYEWSVFIPHSISVAATFAMEVDLVAMSTALDDFLPQTRRLDRSAHQFRDLGGRGHENREHNYEAPPQRLFDASTFLSSSSNQRTASQASTRLQQPVWATQTHDFDAQDIQWGDADSVRRGRQESPSGGNDSPQPVNPSTRRSASSRSYTSSALSPSPSVTGRRSDHSRRRYVDANQTELIAPRERDAFAASQSVERGAGRSVSSRGIRRAIPPLPSQPLLECQLTEASGQGARNVTASGSSFRPTGQIWSTNTLQAASSGSRGGNPVFLTLQLLQIKQYMRKEIISHTPPTTSSPGERLERCQDIAILLYLDSASRRADADVSQVVVACSQHPKTGFVSVVRSRKWSACDSNGSAIDMDDVEEVAHEQPVFMYTCIVLPGTLAAPFIRVSLTPTSRQVRVVRVSLVACAQASTWTERRVVEEPLSRSEESESYRTLHDEADALLVDMDRQHQLGAHNSSALDGVQKAPLPSSTRAREPPTSSRKNQSTQNQRIDEETVGMGVPAMKTPDSNGDTDDSDVEVQHFPSNSSARNGISTFQRENESVSAQHIEEEHDPPRASAHTRPTTPRENIPRSLAQQQQQQQQQQRINKSVVPPAEAQRNQPSSVVSPTGLPLPNPPRDLSESMDDNAIRSKIAMHARKRCLEVLQETPELRRIQQNPAATDRRLVSNGTHPLGRALPPGENTHPRPPSASVDASAAPTTTVQDTVAMSPQQVLSTWGAAPIVPLDRALVYAFSQAPDFAIITSTSVGEAVAASQRSIRCHVLVVARTGESRGRLSGNNSNSNPEVVQDLLRSFVRAVDGSGAVELVMRLDRGCCCRVWSPHLRVSSSLPMRYYFLIDGGCLSSNGASAKQFTDAESDGHVNAAANTLRDVVAIARRVADSCESEFMQALVHSRGGDVSEGEPNTRGRPFPPTLKSFLDLTGVGFVAVFPLLREWLMPRGRAIEYYSPLGGAVSRSVPAALPTHLLSIFLDGATGSIPPTCWFGMILSGQLVHAADGNINNNTSTSGALVPYLHIRLHAHVQSYSVWQPRGNATRVVLANAHVLQHIHQLDGVVASPYMAGVIACANGGPNQASQSAAAGHPPVLTLGSNDGARTSNESAVEFTDRVTFRALGEAYRREWSVVGCAMNFDSTSFDENVFLDTVYRWGYNRPRVLVLFYCSSGNCSASTAEAAGSEKDIHSSSLSWESVLFEGLSESTETTRNDGGGFENLISEETRATFISVDNLADAIEP